MFPGLEENSAFLPFVEMMDNKHLVRGTAHLLQGFPPGMRLFPLSDIVFRLPWDLPTQNWMAH